MVSSFISAEVVELLTLQAAYRQLNSTAYVQQCLACQLFTHSSVLGLEEPDQQNLQLEHNLEHHHGHPIPVLRILPLHPLGSQQLSHLERLVELEEPLRHNLVNLVEQLVALLLVR